MINPMRKAQHARRLNRLKRLLRAWEGPIWPKYRKMFEEFIANVRDPKMLTNCSCDMCRGERYNRTREKRQWLREVIA